MSLPWIGRGRRIFLQITSTSGTFIRRLRMHHLRNPWMQMKICKGSLGECYLCGRQPLVTSLNALYLKSSTKWHLLAHCGGFNHAGYKRRPCPPPCYNDRHEKVRFTLNTMDFKVLIFSCFQSVSFQFLALCIEIVIFQFCFNPPCLSNLIMSN